MSENDQYSKWINKIIIIAAILSAYNAPGTLINVVYLFELHGI